MPETPQETLTPLAVELEILIRQFAQPTYDWQGNPWPPVPDQPAAGGGRLTYTGAHTWARSNLFHFETWTGDAGSPTYIVTPTQVNTYVTLAWIPDNITIRVVISPTTPGHMGNGEHIKELDGCERGTPWGLPWLHIPPTSGVHRIDALVERDLSVLAPLLPLFVSSPTVHGTLGRHCVVRGPVYPDGFIPGETPPERTLTYMRTRPRNVFYTDQGHADRLTAFTSAGQQWQALTPPEQAAWTAAGQTTTPKTHGYALWTRIISRKRLDLIPVFEARTGLSLIAPDYPA